jgi:catechol 2,3-dioxygenase-like lactoylglutathione lyase family enzyme
MVKSRGLNHINLNVSDINRSVRFYREALGLEVDFWEGKKMVFLSSPGARDTITLCQGGRAACPRVMRAPRDRAVPKSRAWTRARRIRGRVRDRRSAPPTW